MSAQPVSEGPQFCADTALSVAKVLVEQVVGEGDLAPEFICQICKLHVASCRPKLTTCSHLFCGDCIDKWLEVHASGQSWASRVKAGGAVPCPVCKEPLRGEKDLHEVCPEGTGGSGALWAMLAATKIVCVNHASCTPGGVCSWEGEYGTYQEHLRTGCGCSALPPPHTPERDDDIQQDIPETSSVRGLIDRDASDRSGDGGPSMPKILLEHGDACKEASAKQASVTEDQNEEKGGHVVGTLMQQWTAKDIAQWRLPILKQWTDGTTIDAPATTEQGKNQGKTGADILAQKDCDEDLLVEAKRHQTPVATAVKNQTSQVPPGKQQGEEARRQRSMWQAASAHYAAQWRPTHRSASHWQWGADALYTQPHGWEVQELHAGAHHQVPPAKSKQAFHAWRQNGGTAEHLQWSHSSCPRNEFWETHERHEV
jgi:hypothetical protein